MHTTSASLLDQLRQPDQPSAWPRFVELYTPLLYYWARRAGMSTDEAADLVQDAFVVLVQQLPRFVYDPQRKFRAWLRTVVLNRWRESSRRRKVPLTANEEALLNKAIPDGQDEVAEREYREHLVRRALHLMQAEFEPTTWKACWEFVVEDRPAAEVAAELGVSVDVVYAAKYRVLRRLRQHLQGLLD